MEKKKYIAGFWGLKHSRMESCYLMGKFSILQEETHYGDGQRWFVAIIQMFSMPWTALLKIVEMITFMTFTFYPN